MLKAKQLNREKSGLTNEKQRQSAFAQIEALKAMLEGVVNDTNQALARLQATQNTMTRVINALITLVGADDVQATVAQQRIDELEAQSAAMEQSLKESVARGEFRPADKIEDNDFLVTTHRNKEGTLLHPEFLHLPLGGHTPEAVEKLKGKSGGQLVELADGTTIYIVNVYRMVPAEERVAASAASTDPAAEGSTTTGEEAPAPGAE